MLKNETITLYGPAILILLIVAWGLGRILYLRLREDVSVLTVLRQEKTDAERALAIIAIILDGYLLLRPLIPDLDQWVYTQQSSIPEFGLTIMLFGLFVVLLCQFAMGKSWRIGVPAEKEESQTLITTGFYAYSRNPIYVGILIFLLGCVVTVPGPITILSLVFTAMFVRTIVKNEEVFMAASFGKEFETYCHEVRRWI
tara:strand:+ start:409 stop:1005 length:597 start_codon:yes stop_codon:yes gene_type:complete